MQEDNPVKFLYNVLKGHARGRGIEFSLSFAHYREVVVSTDYINKRGPGPEDLTIDRIIPELGYTDGNIQVLTKRENVIKRNKDKEIWRPQRFTSYEQAKQINGTPF